MSELMKNERKDFNINLIKNFYLFGIEPDDITISDFESGKNYLKEDFIQIKLLSKFPPTETKSLIDPNIIISHCFPKGYSLKQLTLNAKIENEFFHFSLKNLLSTSYDDKRIYFTCCIFYENLAQYISLKTLKNKYDIKINNKNIIPEEIYIPKLICLSSFIPYPMEFRTILEKLILYVQKNKIKIPIEKVIENLVLGIPFPKQCAFYPIKRNDGCIDTNIDFLLRDLNKYNFYSYKMKSIFIFKIEDIFEIYKYLILEKPILFFSENKEKLTNIFNSFLNLLFPFEYQNPHCAILPECNAGLVEQAKSFVFGINEKWVESTDEKKEKEKKDKEKEKKEKKENYFKRLNLNLFKNILICDIDREKILIYQGYYDTIVMTFDEYKSNTYPNLNPLILTTAKYNNLCNLNPYKEKCRFPLKYSEKLKNKLKEKLFPFNNKINFDYSEKSNEIITEYFYYFLVSILKNYNDYCFNNKDDIININNLFLKKDLKTINIEKIFKASLFIDKEIDKNDDPIFFETLFETDLFKNFLFRKYRNNEIDKYTFLLFDETIIIKKNKNKFSKIKTEFINSKLFSTTISYEVSKTQDFEKSEYNQINSKKKELINYYQNYDGKNLSYYIFPKLLYDDIFFKNKNTNRDNNEWKYLFNEEKLNQIYISYESNKKKIDENLYFKIYEGDLVKRFNFDRKDYIFKNEMNNIIGHLWLIAFCFTFHYCNDIDKKFRFQELMNNLKNLEIPFTKKKIINYIYMTLIKYGNDYMIINFYDYLNLYDYDLYNNFCNRMLLNENYIIENKIKKNNLILKKLEVGGTKLTLNYFKDKDEDETQVKNNSLKLSLTIVNNKDNIDKKNILPKRSFNLEKDNLSFSFNKDFKDKNKEIIVFSSTIKCDNCNTEFDISRLAAEISHMSKQAGLICNHCKKNFVPENLVSVDSYAKNIKIYNPYYLYHVIAIELMDKFGTKIDLDVLKDEYADFYWNCILYFSLSGYSYDILIKYKKDNGDGKENRNRNKINNNKNVNVNNNKRKRFFNLNIQNQKINF